MSDRSASFSTYPRAPDRIAANSDESSSNIVTMRMRTSGCPAMIRRVASMPLQSGIRMSIRITSGRSSAASWIASAPVRASPTATMSGVTANMARTPSRKIG